MNAIARNRAHDFFDTHVLPTVNEWRNAPLDLRLAMQAAAALNQMADHYWYGYSSENRAQVFNQTAVGDFRRELAARSPNFGLIRDVAEAHKHVKLNRKDRLLTSAGQTTVDKLGYGEAEYGVAEWGGSSEVVIELDGGKRRHFSAALEDVVKMWESMLV
jgi:hypothetical protein